MNTATNVICSVIIGLLYGHLYRVINALLIGVFK